MREKEKLMLSQLSGGITIIFTHTKILSIMMAVIIALSVETAKSQ